MPSTYLIDGYNVIHYSSVIRPLLSESIEIARDFFIDKVERFCITSGNKAKIVFDGRGRHQQAPMTSDIVPGLEIVYSRGDLSADALIERMVYVANNRREIVVVSGDMGIRDLCRGLGAFVISSENFIAKVSEVISEVGNEIRTKHQDNSTARIEDSLDNETLLRLEELKRNLSE